MERFCQKLCWTFENDYNFILNHITEITFMFGFIFQTYEPKKKYFLHIIQPTSICNKHVFLNNFTNKIVMSGRYSKSQKLM
jgi:hypothetical protein